MTTVTASTSLVLVTTSNLIGSTIVTFPNISTTGRIITVRDNDGFANSSNYIVLRATAGASFGGVSGSLIINQPFGFITLMSQGSGSYSVLNTFAFPTGSTAAFVSNITATNLATLSTMQFQDRATSNQATMFVSGGQIILNNNFIGQITSNQLQSTVTHLGSLGYLSTVPLFASTQIISSLQTNFLSAGGLTVGVFNPANITTTNLTAVSTNATTGNFRTVSTGALIVSTIEFRSDRLAIGSSAGTNQGQNAVAIGTQAASIGTAQGDGAIAIGQLAGYESQKTAAVAIGIAAGIDNQNTNAVAVGANAGRSIQGQAAVAVGYLTGYQSQGQEAVAIGNSAAYTTQGSRAVAIGFSAASDIQGANAVAIGNNAGFQTQGTSAVAIGNSAGQTTQGSNAVAIGMSAGNNNQNLGAIAIGSLAGILNQSTFAIAIGREAGYMTQGANAVAIGFRAGQTSQSDNTIVLNATGSALNTTTTNATYIKPIRQDLALNTTKGQLYYTSTTGEMTFGPVIVSTFSTLTTNGNIIVLNSVQTPLWVAVGGGTDSIATSTDGTTWTGRGKTVFTNLGYAVAFNGTRWVALGDTPNSIAYSSDGITWTGLGTSIFTTAGFAVAWNGSLWVALGGDGLHTIATSPDGITWTGRGKTIFTTFGRAIAWNGRIWVAGGNGTNAIATSPDGITWTGRGTSILDSGQGFAWNGQMWVGVGFGASHTIAYSYDGITWIGIGKTIFSTQGRAVAWNGSMWVAVGQGTNTIAYSYDGITWTGIGTSLISTMGYGISWNGSVWVAVGQGTNSFATSTDGINWIGRGTSALTVASTGIANNSQQTPDIATQRLNIYSQNVPVFQSSINQILALQSNLVLNNTMYVNNTIARVGINAPSPQYTLDVNGIGHFSNTSSGITSHRAFIGILGTSTDPKRTMPFTQFTDGLTSAMPFDQTSYGTVQITRPADPADRRFHLSFVRHQNFVVGMGFLSNANTWGIQTGGTSNPNGFFADFTNNRIGINTSNPQYTLDVNGDTRIGTTTAPGIGTPLIVYHSTVTANTATSISYIGLRVNDTTNALGILYATDMNHSIWLRTGRDGTANTTNYYQFGSHRFYTGGGIESQSLRMIINNSGNVGINQTNPQFPLDINGQMKVVANGTSSLTTYTTAAGSPDSLIIASPCNAYQGGKASIYFGLNGTATYALGRIVAEDVGTNPPGTYTSQMYFQTNIGGSGNLSTRMMINSNGNVGIGTTNPGYQLDVVGSINTSDSIVITSNSIVQGQLRCQSGAGVNNLRLQGPGVGTTNILLTTSGITMTANGGPGTMFVNASATTFFGSVSKTSGSFEIPHPILENSTLVHSFIEGPRCDLIYRGKKQLSSGIAYVDIEKESTGNGSTMAPGTFVALCTNPQTYLQNNETFDRVLGSVSANILIIRSKNQSSDISIDWMVIAERHDNAVKTWNKTDSNGLLLLEHPKLIFPNT